MNLTFAQYASFPDSNWKQNWASRGFANVDIVYAYIPVAPDFIALWLDQLSLVTFISVLPVCISQKLILYTVMYICIMNQVVQCIIIILAVFYVA